MARHALVSIAVLFASVAQATGCDDERCRFASSYDFSDAVEDSGSREASADGPSDGGIDVDCATRCQQRLAPGGGDPAVTACRAVDDPSGRPTLHCEYTMTGYCGRNDPKPFSVP
jgi:hypothetical protein